ncbi:MAG: Ig-like domain-containing protein, partial [Prolixibacteraceae bacterium]|nr:Ig-like domain-containing protein [Prolixibacteraceae bacterium]
EIIRIDIDRTAPIIEPGLSYPANGDLTVPLDAEISIVFSEMIYGYVGPGVEPIDATDFSLKAGEVDIPFTFTVSANGEVVTLTPLSALTENTAYTVTIQSIADAYGNSTSIITRTFETDKLNQWIGGGDVTNWSDLSNWMGGSYAPFKSVTIPASATAFPVIDDETVNIHNLIVEPGAVLTLTGTGVLNITGIFNLQSSSDVNASFLQKGGSLNVNSSNVRFEQAVSNSGLSLNYNSSASVSGATKASSGITGIAWYYDNPSNTYVTIGDNEPFTVGRGFIFKNSSSIVFSGTPNSGVIPVSLMRTKTGKGWNLVGNPYPTGVNWGLLGKSNVEDSFWLWLNEKGIYGTYNDPTGLAAGMDPLTPDNIPSHQSFFVKVPIGAENGTLTFNPEAMVPNAFSYLKASGTKYPSLKLTSSFNGNIDETAIALVPDATNTASDIYDSEKYLSYNVNYGEIYTLSGSTRLVVNGLPSSQDMVIPIGLSIQAPGTITLALQMSTLPANSSVFLKDKNTDDIVDLTSGQSYTFSLSTKGFYNERFELIISTSTNVTLPEGGDSSIKENVTVYTSDSKIIAYIRGLEQPVYYLYDLNGRLIDSGDLTNDAESIIPVQNKGLFVFVVMSGKGKADYKVVF